MRPNLTLLVIEDDNDIPNIELNYPVKIIVNKRKRSLSGAVNQALEEILKSATKGNWTRLRRIALLIDDWRDPDISKKCLRIDSNSQQIVTGLILT